MTFSLPIALPEISRPFSAGREIIIDSFAGGGGASTGIEMALGRSPDVAINHDPEAVALHAANHPDTRHFCKSVYAVDPADVAAGRPVGLLWASPDCRHFSEASGGRSIKSAQVRDLGWSVVQYAQRVRPRVVIVENVRQYPTWGPLDASGVPIADRQGETYRRWLAALRREGYRVETRLLNTADYGAPTNRVRLFIIARRDGLPVVWPSPSHGAGSTPHRTLFDCIDWTIPCRPIDHREKPLVPATLRRIENGLRRYVLETDSPVWVPVDVSPGCWAAGYLVKLRGTCADGQRLDRPAPTITAGGNHLRLVVAILTPDGAVQEIRSRLLTPRELFTAQGFPADYVIEGPGISRRSQLARCGNSVPPPVAAALVAANCADMAILREAAE